jgi:hypothetical protein
MNRRRYVCFFTGKKYVSVILRLNESEKIKNLRLRKKLQSKKLLIHRMKRRLKSELGKKLIIKLKHSSSEQSYSSLLGGGIIYELPQGFTGNQTDVSGLCR